MPEIHNGVPRRFEKRLKKSLGDEVRVDIMRVLDERPATIRELAEQFGERLSGIAPHVLELWNERSIDLHDDDHGVPLADRRFRTCTVIFDAEEWRALPPDEQFEATVRILEGLIGEAMVALRSGHLGARPDSHLSWMPVTVDEDGWRETTEMLERTFREANAIKARCAERLRESGDRGTSIIVSMLEFERGR